MKNTESPIVETQVLSQPRKFPSINRFITEQPWMRKAFFLTKILIVGIVTGWLLFQIFLQGYALRTHLTELDHISVERQRISEEIAYWKQTAEKYQGYRDVYYRIASLEYKLGNISAAKEYVKKAIELDPNFAAGRVLGEKLR